MSLPSKETVQQFGPSNLKMPNQFTHLAKMIKKGGFSAKKTRKLKKPLDLEEEPQKKCL